MFAPKAATTPQGGRNSRAAGPLGSLDSKEQRKEAMQLIRYGLTVSIATIALAFGCKASITAGGESAAPTASPVAATPPPPVDSDGDGIPDDKDACKDKAGTANDDAAKNGCPAEAPKMMAAPVQKVEVVGSEIKIKEKIMFEKGKAAIQPESDKLIDELAAVIKEKGQDIELIEVGGHADKDGHEKDNLKLTESRSKAVVEALVKRGVDAKKLRAKGYGEYCPEDPGDSPEAHEKNRRVQFAILKIKGKKTDMKLGCDAAAKAGVKPDPIL
jgi:OOP family OmpA-OmpF porin